MNGDAAVWKIAATVCTERQLTCLRLRDQGLSQVAIALHLGISRATVRDHLREAEGKIERAMRGAA